MKTLLSILAFALLSVSLPAATTYSLVWDAPPVADKVTFVNIYKKVGTVYTLLATLPPTVLKWAIPNAQSGET